MNYLVIALLVIIIVIIVLIYLWMTQSNEKGVFDDNSMDKYNGEKFRLTNQSLIVRGDVTLYQFVNLCDDYDLFYPIGQDLSGTVADEISKGSIGLIQRVYGNLSDYVTSFVINTPSLGTIMCSPTFNSLLYWAVRGSGYENFGVIQYMEFRLNKKPDKIQIFKIKYPPDFINYLTNWVVTMNERGVNSRFSCYLDISKTNFEMRGIFVGGTTGLRKVLNTLPRGQGWGLNVINRTGNAFYLHLDDDNMYRKRYLKSYFVRNKFGQRELRFLKKSISNINGTYSYQVWASMNEKLSISSMNHGNAMILLKYEWNNDNAEDNIEWKFDQMAALAQNVITKTSNRSCPRYYDEYLYSCHKSYYGKKLKKLKEIKQYVDPGNVCKSGNELDLV